MTSVITAVIIVGVVVGGVIGSSTTTGNSNGPAAPTDSTSKSTPASQRQTGAAVMNVSGSMAANVQLVYQDLETTDLFYQLIWDDQAGAEQRIVIFDPTPQQGTPIAVTTANMTANDGIMTNIFYLSSKISNSSLSDICLVTLQCPLGAESCNVSIEGSVRTAALDGVLSDSGLAAVSLPNGSDFRVYYKSGRDTLRVLAGNGTASSSWKDSSIGGQSFSGSDISVNYDQDQDQIQVVLVDSATEMLGEIDYSDGVGVEGNTGKNPMPISPC